jgi:SAM-dependent methyltransferase
MAGSLMIREQMAWNLEFIAQSDELRAPDFGIPETTKRVAYPFRIMRYWFAHHLLLQESRRQGRPLDICEIGVDRGQMFYFTQAACADTLEKPWNRWTAVDCRLKEDILRSHGYTDLVEANIAEAAPKVDGQYDLVILLHILEHLHEPEAALIRLLPTIKPGGTVIGGFPVTPEPFRAGREKKLRKNARPFRHVSAFSPQRVRAMAAEAGLEVEFISGAFMMRKKGFFLENHAWWWRLNLAFGARFPGWPGEIYWLLRKPG